jgi:hypothetical protein
MHFLRKDKQVQDPRDERNLSTAGIAAERPRGPQLVEEERVAQRDEGRQPESLREEEHQEYPAALFAENDVRDMRSRWDKIQAGFVDEPRQVVKQADELVAFAIKRIAEQFANERSQLEQQWDRGDNVSTEDLRLALRRYRTFFDRLLSV